MSDRVWLYNRSCLYAQAYMADNSKGYELRAIEWLGKALVISYDADLWDYALSDPELTPIRRFISPFVVELRSLIAQNDSAGTRTDTGAIVTQALAVIV